jgi:sodium/potassium/calcium exchanger 6
VGFLFLAFFIYCETDNKFVKTIGDQLKWWYLPAAFAVGITSGLFTYRVFKTTAHPGRIVLCFVGFFVAMVWILLIVNEVVGVLQVCVYPSPGFFFCALLKITFVWQAMGQIFHVSDAILGTTIFAMGNSLGDFVSDITVARMGFPGASPSALTFG